MLGRLGEQFSRRVNVEGLWGRRGWCSVERKEEQSERDGDEKPDPSRMIPHPLSTYCVQLAPHSRGDNPGHRAC